MWYAYDCGYSSVWISLLIIACSHPPWRSVSVKRTLSGLSSSDKEDADVPSVAVSFHVHALHAKQQQAIVQQWDGNRQAQRTSTQTFISSLQQASCTSIWCHCDLLQIAPQQSYPNANRVAGFKCCSGLLSSDLFKLPFSQTLRSSRSSLT